MKTMQFPAGRTILLILVFAMVGSFGQVISIPNQTMPDQVVWTFDPSHLATYTRASGSQPPLTELHHQLTGRNVVVELMPSRALDARLLSLILANTRGRQVPDVVEIEIGSVGKYFRAAPDNVGLLPLDGFIAHDPAARDLLPSRVASWTHAGRVYGIPRDVHPVTLTYREDLFREAGIDLSACQDWISFRNACRKYQLFWSQRGIDRRAMQLSRWSASDLMILIQQQHITLFDHTGRPSLSSPALARTIAFYATLVAGDDAISSPVSSNVSARDLAEGHTAALFTPDWRIEYLRWDPDLLGKLRMMPLPRFSPDDARTASWGGTMVAIPRNCRDPEAAWQLLKNLQLTPAAVKARQYHSSIIPAITSAWEDPAWDDADPLYGGQAIGRLYIELSRELPEQRISPYMAAVSQTIAAVLSDAQAHLEKHGEAQLEDFCARRLGEEERRLARLLDFAEERP